MDLAGTISFLMDSKIEALRYWNRLNRPHLTDIQINSPDPIIRQRITEEINLVPGDLLSVHEIDAARWRLHQHRSIGAARFQPIPGAGPDQYSLQVDADTRRGFGARTEFLFNTLSNIGFHTWHLTWWDIAGKGVTSDLLWRWRTDARRVNVNFDVPRPGHLPVYASAYYNWRDESWFFSRDFNNPESDFRLRTHEIGMRFVLPLRIPQLSLETTTLARRRSFDFHGTAPADASRSSLETARKALWLRFSPVLQLRGRDPQSASGINSRIRAELGAGRARDPSSESFSRFSVSWESRIDWITRNKLQQTLLLGLHAGQLSNPVLVEDHFVLGIGPDADFWLRAHPFLRDGKPGQSPLAGQLLLGNLTAASDIKSWKWIKIGALAFLDLAQLPRLYPGQTVHRVLADAGIGIELGSPIVPARRFTIVWGHDTRTNRNVFYLATSFR